MKSKILFFFLLLIPILFAEDVPLTTDSRIRTLVYNPNEVYQVKFHYGFQSFIEFAPDEEIEIISLGEAFPWKITPINKRLFVRPVQIDIKTNMTIITTKRTYQFEIEGLAFDEKANEDLVYSIRFFYPDKELKKPKMAGKGSGEQNETINVRDGFALNNIERGDIVNFNYTMTGNGVNITPVKVFDDGKSTYFQFAKNNILVPTFSIVDIYGKETKIDYYMDGDYVVVRAIGVQFALRNGRELLCIFNNSVM
ncbi:MAG: TrbG/VirB9 family P-type conjugative transfer protein [Rickettsiales bacterium]|jgi:type IV secretion system protein VirB9|nr:TrbG/VirB9 family P-type conjugative transfer protein [Rickettsiales bacterium]